MSDKAKSWGPVILAGAIAIMQLMTSYALYSIDGRLGRVETVLMEMKK